MKVIILMAGENTKPTQDGNYPLFLTELDGKMVLELLLEKCMDLKNADVTCIILEKDNKEYHIENIINLINPNVSVIKILNRTQGALCTTLLALSEIDPEKNLLILNGNEILKINLQEVVNDFLTKNYDAGTVVFPSIHPRYSFVQVNEEGLVLEAAEKNPISHFATAGFYWFSKGKYFVEGAKNILRKDNHHNGTFYICPVFNELILQNHRIGTYLINKKFYLPLKSEHQLNQARG